MGDVLPVHSPCRGASHHNVAVHHITMLRCITSQRCGASHHNVAVHHITMLRCITSQCCGASHHNVVVHHSVAFHLPNPSSSPSQHCGASHHNVAVHHITTLWCITNLRCTSVALHTGRCITKRNERQTYIYVFHNGSSLNFLKVTVSEMVLRESSLDFQLFHRSMYRTRS